MATKIVLTNQMKKTALVASISFNATTRVSAFSSTWFVMGLVIVPTSLTRLTALHLSVEAINFSVLTLGNVSLIAGSVIETMTVGTIQMKKTAMSRNPVTQINFNAVTLENAFSKPGFVMVKMIVQTIQMKKTATALTPVTPLSSNAVTRKVAFRTNGSVMATTIVLTCLTS